MHAHHAPHEVIRGRLGRGFEQRERGYVVAAHDLQPQGGVEAPV